MIVHYKDSKHFLHIYKLPALLKNPKNTKMACATFTLLNPGKFNFSLVSAHTGNAQGVSL